MDPSDEVRHDLEDLGALLRAQRELTAKLEAVAELVERAVPECDAASVTLVVEERLLTGAASSQLAIEVDLVQYREREGPCIDSSREGRPIRVDALQHDERYVHLAPGAVEAGVESVLSLPLVADGDVVGSMNLYSRAAHAFPDGPADRLGDLVDYAARLIADSDLYRAGVGAMTRLVEAVQQSDMLHIAAGMLIFRSGLRPEEAWEQLRRDAEADGVSLLEAARRLVAEHERRPDRDGQGG